MKKLLKEFCLRGLTFCAGGPLILAVVYLITGGTGAVTALDPVATAREILTVTALAFIAAGITVVYQAERLPLMAAIAIHGGVLYADYILIYLLNGWLKSQLVPVLIFTAVFLLGYGLIWLCIYAGIRRKTEALNAKLPGNR